LHKNLFGTIGKTKTDFNGIAPFCFSSQQLLVEEVTGMKIQSGVGGQHHPMLVVESKLVVVESKLVEEVSEQVVVENVLGEMGREQVLVEEES